MTGWGSYTFLFGPLVALVAVAVLALLLRWTFSRGTSLVEKRPRTGRESDYGLLVPVAQPATFTEAEAARRRLAEVGIRATLAPTIDGLRVMVFARDAAGARAHLAGPRPG